MATHDDFGKEGEQLAAAWLKENGFEIIQLNWRYSHYEIDVVANKGKFLHFIEAKARNYSPMGFPEDSVTRKKFKYLQRAVDEYLFLNPGHQWISYDILSITFYKDKEVEYFFIEDVFLQ